MQCLICNGPMNFFFSKKFDGNEIGDAEYWNCAHCGFTLSKTHAELTPDKWERVNNLYHSGHQGSDFCDDDPKWITRLNTQAAVISDLADLGIIPGETDWIDFACGDGKLSNILEERHSLELKKYDRYMGRTDGYLSAEQVRERAFGFVVTTSVFEHFTNRADFDRVEALVAEEGVFGLHTLVCESVPQDPTWFYLLPVHCAFHTNKSMSILFRQWGYTSSIYSVEAQLWLWFRTDPARIRSIIEAANKRESGPKYVFKRDFVDYWKISPYRT